VGSVGRNSFRTDVLQDRVIRCRAGGDRAL